MTTNELFRAVVRSAVIGALVGIAISYDARRGLLQGALSGALLTTFGWIAHSTGWTDRVREWPFAASIAVTAFVNAAVIGVALAAASLPWLATARPGRPFEPITFIVVVLVSLALALWFALDQLLGREVLVGLLTGRYHRPRREQRVFLFADLWESTPLAGQLGELRYHAFLDRAFKALALPVVRHGGTIHEYVGDEVVVTWPLERAARDGNCLRCAHAMLDAVAASAPAFRHEFGAAPRFRIAIHCGWIVAGVMGDLRREIAFSGEAVNTTARIEDVAKELERDLVVSADVLEHVALPADLSAESLGVRVLRGSERPIELFALEASSP